ncbi:MAG: L-arabinose transport system permease protein AraQ [Firmicutes bacterium ADurb.Bin193]|nr:MAG: L-arabinose transport system permease protein AraQ [Firmicutes bacterium ADurb.Bin193]
MKIKRSLGEKIFTVFNVFILSLLTLATLYPFMYVVFASLSDPTKLATHVGVLLKPAGFSLKAYKSVIEYERIISGYRNTIFYVVTGTALNIFMTSLGAYVLSRKDFILKKIMMKMIVISMLFHGGLIPTYLLVRSLGLLDSVWAIIIPSAIGTWNLIIMRTSFSSIPDSLTESAAIDGANDFTIMFRIVLPLSMSVIAVMILYYGVGHWNSWFSAMIYLLRARHLHPLQLVLREIILSNSTTDLMLSEFDVERQDISETIKYAAIMVAILPIIAVYPFLQKYFVKGVMIGALKG